MFTKHNIYSQKMNVTEAPLQFFPNIRSGIYFLQIIREEFESI